MRFSNGFGPGGKRSTWSETIIYTEGCKDGPRIKKTIIEHPEFPGAEELVQAFLLIEKIDLAELKQANHLYYQSLEKRYAEDKSVSSRWESEVLEDYSRVDGSNVHELRSVVVMEYLKSVIGKQHEIDVISRYGLDSEANLVEQ